MFRHITCLIAAFTFTACYGEIGSGGEDERGTSMSVVDKNEEAWNDKMEAAENAPDPWDDIMDSEPGSSLKDNGEQPEGQQNSGGGSGSGSGGSNSSGVNHAPTGVLDGVAGGVARGWACDKDEPNWSIKVHIYVGGAAGSGAKGYSVLANRSSESSVAQACGGGNAHRFQYQIPNWSAFAKQKVYAYAIDSAGGKNALLNNAPQALPAGSSAPAPSTSSDPAPSPAPTKPEPSDPEPSDPAPPAGSAECTYGVPNQCAGIYQACTINGACVSCPTGLKNCDRQSDCGTPTNESC